MHEATQARTTATTVGDGGLETDLIHHHGVELADFAAFPLVEDEAGRTLLGDYFAAYADIARRVGANLVLAGATWRANPDWGARLGYDAAALDRANRAAIEFLHRLRDRIGPDGTTVRGTIGPRSDGYRPGDALDADAAAAYHRPQLQSFAAAGADGATAYTLTHTGEAIGIVRAAREAGVPIAIGFTVETDGRLADGTSLRDAVTAVDAVAPPDYFAVNCAHPTHIAHAIAGDGAWRARIEEIKPNASRRSHAELDDAEDLDEGDIADFGATTRAVVGSLPNVRIVGGCCGTDARHVAAAWSAPDLAPLGLAP